MMTVTQSVKVSFYGIALGLSLNFVANAKQAMATAEITTPIEVSDGSLGAAPATLPVKSCNLPVKISFTLDANALAKVRSLYLQTHGLKYSREASIQINTQLSTHSPWVSLMNPDELAKTQTTAVFSPTNPNLEVLGSGGYYGGIGGAFTVLKMTINLVDGQTFGKRTGSPLVVGNNEISFCFNGTDGRVSGYRIIDLNLLDASGKNLTDASGNAVIVTQLDNPSEWKAPLHQNGSAASVSNGATLWKSASLEASKMTAAGAIHSKCVDCHTQSGSDLYYFNYSNQQIIQRAIFHGLSHDQGVDLAAFIRNVPNQIHPGRPWNPPYQPGAGIDSQPVANWSAGAGVGSILDSDRSAFPWLAGWGRKGSSFVDPSSNTIETSSIREFPMAFQFPDWNEWLPTIHPLDAMRISSPSQSVALTNFLSARAGLNGLNYNGYESIREKLESPTADYLSSGLFSDITGWCSGGATAARQVLELDAGKAYGGYNSTTGLVSSPLKALTASYSVAQLSAVKMWEFHHDFPASNLETRGTALFGVSGERSSWYANDRCIFDVSPHGSSAGFATFTDYAMTGDMTYRNTHPQYARNHPLTSAGLGDPRVSLTEYYLASAWYELHMTLNPGNHLMAGGGHSTTDWGYMNGFTSSASTYTGVVEPMRMSRFFLNAMRQHDNQLPPTAQTAEGWDLVNHLNPRFAGIIRSGPQYKCESEECATAEPSGPALYPATDWNSHGDYPNVPQTLYQIWLERVAQFTPAELQAVRGPYDPDGTISPPGTYVFWSYVNPPGFSSTGDADDYFHRSVVDTWDGNPGYVQQLKALRDQIGKKSTSAGDYDQSTHTSGAVVDGFANLGELIWPGTPGRLNPWSAYRSPAGSIIAPQKVEAVGTTTPAGGIEIQWEAINGASSYNVKRTTNPSDPYQTIAYFVTTENYIDPYLSPGVRYYYKISANVGNTGGDTFEINSLEGPDSQAANAVPATGLIGDWSWNSETSGDGGTVVNSVEPSFLPGKIIKQTLPGQVADTGFLSFHRSLELWLGNSATLTAWIKIPAGKTQTGAISGGDFPGGILAQWGNLSSTGILSSRFSCTRGDPGNQVSPRWPTSLGDNQWHFVAISRSATTGDVNMSVDGAKALEEKSGAGECPTQIRSFGKVEGIGSGYGQGVPFSGAIHRVRLYNEAMSGSRIEALYDAKEEP